MFCPGGPDMHFSIAGVVAGRGSSRATAGGGRRECPGAPVQAWGRYFRRGRGGALGPGGAHQGGPNSHPSTNDHICNLPAMQTLPCMLSVLLVLGYDEGRASPEPGCPSGTTKTKLYLLTTMVSGCIQANWLCCFLRRGSSLCPHALFRMLPLQHLMTLKGCASACTGAAGRRQRGATCARASGAAALQPQRPRASLPECWQGPRTLQVPLTLLNRLTETL